MAIGLGSIVIDKDKELFDKPGIVTDINGDTVTVHVFEKFSDEKDEAGRPKSAIYRTYYIPIEDLEPTVILG
ncbi:MAG TPA: hypothetical protein VIM64_11575 [Puia sp.]